jgi:hypothetical protein
VTQYVGLDISMKETKLHVLDDAGKRVWRGCCATEPAAIAAAVRRYAPAAARIGLETVPLMMTSARLGNEPNLLDRTIRTPGAGPVEFNEVNGTGEGVRFRKPRMESDSRSLARALALRCSASTA